MCQWFCGMEIICHFDSERYQAAQRPVRDHTDYASVMNYIKHHVGPFKIVHSKPTSLEIMLGAGQAGAGKAKESGDPDDPSKSEGDFYLSQGDQDI